jgi:hypothetical protein
MKEQAKWNDDSTKAFAMAHTRTKRLEIIARPIILRKIRGHYTRESHSTQPNADTHRWERLAQRPSIR